MGNIKRKSTNYYGPGTVYTHSLLDCEIPADPQLIFDGENLHWDGPSFARSWPAYSGIMRVVLEKDFDVETQKIKNYGPIPEGIYYLHQKNYQKYNETIDKFRQLMTRGRGAWPGGVDSWGTQRIWLEPDENTETWGRSGFSIHGGRTPGSIGCIDLTDCMPSFVKRFLEWGKSLRLEVNYKYKK